MTEESKDWRIGKRCKPKYRYHRFWGETQGEIIDVLPDGTDGWYDKDGILKILLDNGEEIIECADYWVIA